VVKYVKKKLLKNLHVSQKGRNFASLLKTKPPAQRSNEVGEEPLKEGTRGVAQLVRVRVWGA